MVDRARLEFASVFDERLFLEGPPAMFTLDPMGRLRVDPERTREGYLLVGSPQGRDPGHFVLVDQATGLRMYTLVSHAALATCQPRAEVRRHADFTSAIAEAMQQWAVPAPQALDGGDEEP